MYTTDDAFLTGSRKALKLLDAHYESFCIARPFADETGHSVPSDTKSWSQILVSILTGLNGRERKKGSDLDDGSDVKAANVWGAIDAPRFNGAIPAGRTTDAARKPSDVTALDDMPFIFFVLWDEEPETRAPRCRIWVVRTAQDGTFRSVAAEWYSRREAGAIKSSNFQLHPPRNRNDDVFRNQCGNLNYPLFFSAVRRGERYEVETLDHAVLTQGTCTAV